MFSGGFMFKWNRIVAVTLLSVLGASVVGCGAEINDSGSEANAVRRTEDSRMALVSVMYKEVNANESNILACGYEVDLDADRESLVSPLNARAYSSELAAFERKLLESVGGVVAIGGSSLGFLLTLGGLVIAPVMPPAAVTILPGVALLGASSITGGAMLSSASNKLSEANAVESTLLRMSSGEHVRPVFYDEYKQWIAKSGNTFKRCPSEKVDMLLGLLDAQ